MKDRATFEAEFMAADREYAEATAALSEEELGRWRKFIEAYYTENPSESLQRKVATTVKAYESGDPRISPALHRMYRALMQAARACADLMHYYPKES
jgi:hypothetical protein